MRILCRSTRGFRRVHCVEPPVNDVVVVFCKNHPGSYLSNNGPSAWTKDPLAELQLVRELNHGFLKDAASPIDIR
jgi:hypothetical protein